MKILISKDGKTRRVEVSDSAANTICILKVFFPPDTPVKLGKYNFLIKHIEPWPPPEQISLL